MGIDVIKRVLEGIITRICMGDHLIVEQLGLVLTYPPDCTKENTWKSLFCRKWYKKIKDILPVPILVVILLSQAFTIIHLHVNGLSFSDFVGYYLLGFVIWIIGTILVYPAVERTLARSQAESHNFVHYITLEKMFSVLLDKRSKPKLKPLNYCVLNLAIVLLTLLPILLFWFPLVVKNNDIYLWISAPFYLLLWMVAVSGVVVSFRFSYDLYTTLTISRSMHDYILDKYIEKIVRATWDGEQLEGNLSNCREGYPLKCFMEFKKELKRIFAPILSIALRTIIVISLVFYILALLPIIGKNLSSKEIHDLKTTLYIILIPALSVVVIFTYLIFRLSFKFKSIFITELGEVKLRFINEENQMAVQIVDLFEKLLSEDPLLFASSRNIGEVAAAIVALLINAVIFIFQTHS
ncbi:hypothetical protein [Thermococcus sp. MAR1]|uniref:hypothetical protein n=1 Tax=Thermococcus sp. MAR1 TaxID=1638263 RepID=UPI00143BA05B|nr:hypothetical protein [Thermococcus sp. MAR1]NJE10260.1 hypothetical protein [Thermococcus sp. MAR1]